MPSKLCFCDQRKINQLSVIVFRLLLKLNQKTSGTYKKDVQGRSLVVAEWVTSNARGPRIESRHIFKHLLTINVIKLVVH